MYRATRCLLLFFLLLLLRPTTSCSFALLAHEAIVDATWDKSIKPLLKLKYPKATEEELKKAHAYVYGGTIIPDLGYYPLGRTEFSNLLHYVRTGDFINNLFEQSETLN